MEIFCPFCNASNELSTAVPGQHQACQHCGREFMVPRGDGTPAAAPGVRTHMMVVGTLQIILGILTGLWMLFMIGMTIGVVAGALDQMLAEQGNLQNKNGIAVVYAVCGGLSFVQAALQLIGGIGVIRRKAFGRLAAIAGSVAGIVSLWSCCLFLFSLPVGIYSLVVLCRSSAADDCQS